MTKTYYKSEYSDKQWRALIDKALGIGCKVTYSCYGGSAEIDSAEVEDGLEDFYADTIGHARRMWAEHIHKMIQRAAE